MATRFFANIAANPFNYHYPSDRIGLLIFEALLI
jgi:hypothetical protein